MKWNIYNRWFCTNITFFKYTTLKTQGDFKKIFKKPTQDTKVNFVSTFSTDSTKLRYESFQCNLYGETCYMFLQNYIGYRFMSVFFYSIFSQPMHQDRFFWERDNNFFQIPFFLKENSDILIFYTSRVSPFTIISCRI